MPPALFWFGYFINKILLFAQVSLHWDPPTIRFHARFFCIEMGSRKLFYPGWPWTAILLISASQVEVTSCEPLEI
jgi:hypothetical protein